MRALRRTLIALLCLSPVLAFAAPAAPSLQVAVSPFANSGADKAADYIGFQAAEFFSSALLGYPGVQVVERTQLMKILSEQELQLSGVTDDAKSVSVGKILNARQILVGSFELTKATLTLNGRLVDVESGAVLSKAMVQTPRADSYSDVYKAFLFKLLSGLHGYETTIGVEARVENLQAQSAAASDDYAKALAALYRKDDQAAYAYLQSAIGGSQVGFVGYGAAADRFVETLTRVRGSSRYAKMVQKQVETNKELMEQVEPLSVYRSTLKILADRAVSSLPPDSFAVAGDPASAIEFADGSVSTKVTLPQKVSIELKAEARQRLMSLFAKQEAVSLGASGLKFASPASGKLLSQAALSGGFDLSVRASMSLSVQFLDAKGKVVYELVSAPVSVLALSATESRYSSGVPFNYRPSGVRDGWALNADGSLVIQARALADLDSVRYSIKTSDYRAQADFPFDSDLRWRSLITHAYRKYSIKVASGTDDPAPQFKDVLITDSFFSTADPALGRVPALPRDGGIAAYAKPTAVVYCADNSREAVTAAWDGAIKGNSKPFLEGIGPETVLYFDAPSFDKLPSGRQEFTARLGAAQVGKTASVALAWGFGWISKEYIGSSTVFAVAPDSVYSGDAALSSSTGKLLWRAQRSGSYPILEEGAVLYADTLRRLDPKTGAVLSEGKNLRGQELASALIYGGKLFTLSIYGYIGAADKLTGSQFWQSTTAPMYTFPFDSGRIYYDSGEVVDAETGKVLYRTEGRKASVAAGEAIVWGNGVCSDRKSGKTLWRYAKSGGRVPTYGDGVVYFGGNAAVRASDGVELWQREMDSNVYASFLAGDTLYAYSSNAIYALDPATGNTKWSGLSNGRVPAVVGDSFYTAINAFIARYDLSLLSDAPRAGQSARSSVK